MSGKNKSSSHPRKKKNTSTKKTQEQILQDKIEEIKSVCPEWVEEDIRDVLRECNFNVNVTVDKILSGDVEPAGDQWTEVPARTRKTKEQRQKEKEDKEKGSNRDGRVVSNRGRGRGGRSNGENRRDHDRGKRGRQNQRGSGGPKRGDRGFRGKRPPRGGHSGDQNRVGAQQRQDFPTAGLVDSNLHTQMPLTGKPMHTQNQHIRPNMAQRNQIPSRNSRQGQIPDNLPTQQPEEHLLIQEIRDPPVPEHTPGHSEAKEKKTLNQDNQSHASVPLSKPTSKPSHTHYHTPQSPTQYTKVHHNKGRTVLKAWQPVQKDKDTSIGINQNSSGSGPQSTQKLNSPSTNSPNATPPPSPAKSNPVDIIDKKKSQSPVILSNEMYSSESAGRSSPIESMGQNKAPVILPSDIYPPTSHQLQFGNFGLNVEEDSTTDRDRRKGGMRLAGKESPLRSPANQSSAGSNGDVLTDLRKSNEVKNKQQHVSNMPMYRAYNMEMDVQQMAAVSGYASFNPQGHSGFPPSYMHPQPSSLPPSFDLDLGNPLQHHQMGFYDPQHSNQQAFTTSYHNQPHMLMTADPSQYVIDPSGMHSPHHDGHDSYGSGLDSEHPDGQHSQGPNSSPTHRSPQQTSGHQDNKQIHGSRQEESISLQGSRSSPQLQQTVGGQQSPPPLHQQQPHPYATQYAAPIYGYPYHLPYPTGSQFAAFRQAPSAMPFPHFAKPAYAPSSSSHPYQTSPPGSGVGSGSYPEDIQEYAKYTLGPQQHIVQSPQHTFFHGGTVPSEGVLHAPSGSGHASQQQQSHQHQSTMSSSQNQQHQSKSQQQGSFGSHGSNAQNSGSNNEISVSNAGSSGGVASSSSGGAPGSSFKNVVNGGVDYNNLQGEQRGGVVMGSSNPQLSSLSQLSQQQHSQLSQLSQHSQQQHSFYNNYKSLSHSPHPHPSLGQHFPHSQPQYSQAQFPFIQPQLVAQQPASISHSHSHSHSHTQNSFS
eukprot:CAMPEP_0174253184 /NCGR_PEP_ID=MMETSP0439-20130205/2575_1 /TAXON_ID=0 /ORGANISM="Stereomyxa ramosa, Strain Chinc5" /LENGTH=977 /DNA_ID=CAMNT_0015334079 /DNA_START=69 /DNA_END=3002 /DNA_ORIENTATION=-